jgi:hypothetical protein
MFVNIFIYLLPCNLFKILFYSIDDPRSYMESIHLVHATLSIVPLVVVDNLPFDHIFLVGIHQTDQITSDRAVLFR